MHTCTTCGAACNALSPTMDCPVCYADALGHGRALDWEGAYEALCEAFGTLPSFVTSDARNAFLAY